MQPGASTSAPAEPAGAGLPPPCSGSSPAFSAFDVKLYRAFDELTGAILCVMVVFSPWAFGTTQAWSIWTMNIGGYLLGVLLLSKLAIRYLRGYAPSRWAFPLNDRSIQSVINPAASERRPYPGRALSPKAPPRSTYVPLYRSPIVALAILTALLLAWCLISAINALATFHNESLTFDYHDCLRWLPHSLDRDATWAAFWMYLGLACTFWSLRDWLLGKSASEMRADWQSPRSVDPNVSRQRPENAPLLPARLRRLLWLLAISGALLGVEAIIQRAANSPRLLFLVQPRIHQTAGGQFGPYAYRSNAAQYFNLLWPVCLGFWWTLNRNAPRRKTIHHLLLVAAAIMAACPIVSTSRAGAIISLAMAIIAGVFLALTHSRYEASSLNPRRTVRIVTICLGAALLLGLILGWKNLAPRMGELNSGLIGREGMYDIARPIAEDYPLFGTGPASFETVSQLYPRPDIFWPAQLHNDWLETRITFGWLGSALIAAAFLCSVLAWFSPGAIHGGRRFVALIWLALAGCLLHARFDFPFQIHSTLFLFLLLCGVLSVLSRRTRAPH